MAEESRAAVVVPFSPLPATPPSSTKTPTPPCANSPPHLDSAGQQSQPNAVPTSPTDLQPAPEGKDEAQEQEPQHTVPSVTETDLKLHLEAAGLDCSPSPVSVVSHESFSDLSRPSSSLFSRSTNLSSSRMSILSGKASAVLVELALGLNLPHKMLKLITSKFPSIFEYFLPNS